MYDDCDFSPSQAILWRVNGIERLFGEKAVWGAGVWYSLFLGVEMVIFAVILEICIEVGRVHFQSAVSIIWRATGWTRIEVETSDVPNRLLLTRRHGRLELDQVC